MLPGIGLAASLIGGLLSSGASKAAEGRRADNLARLEQAKS